MLQFPLELRSRETFINTQLIFSSQFSRCCLGLRSNYTYDSQFFESINQFQHPWRQRTHHWWLEESRLFERWNWCIDLLCLSIMGNRRREYLLLIISSNPFHLIISHIIHPILWNYFEFRSYKLILREIWKYIKWKTSEYKVKVYKSRKYFTNDLVWRKVKKISTTMFAGISSCLIPLIRGKLYVSFGVG